ncbi:MAG: hypothetical protein H7240_10800 [Glaciimonas sp.]|nr:hypothetical protein [Glaciimonas sp.]
MISRQKNFFLWTMGIALLFPLFFQLSGGIYRAISSVVNSQGILETLPLPISILASFLLVFFLPNNLYRARVGLVMVIAVLAVSLASVLFGGDTNTSNQRKLLMTAQVLLPLTGLLLGQLLQDGEKIISRAFLLVLSAVVPLQLLATWIQGGLVLTHYLYAFSIYSHFQYVTLIFVCAFGYCLTSLWDEHKIWLCMLSLWMSIYAVSSLSFLTIFAYFALMSAFLICKLWRYRSNAKTIGIAVILIAVTILASYAYFKKMDAHRISADGQQSFYYGKFKELANGKIPLNVQERFGDWQLFGNGILESEKTFFVGHAQPMPREVRSSPHNFYIDIAYTFGVLGLFPIVGLIGYTGYLCWQRRRNLSESTWWLFVIVAYLVLIDSNFKVTLRQPYPGIFAYFLWGLLLSRLQSALPGEPHA